MSSQQFAQVRNDDFMTSYRMLEISLAWDPQNHFYGQLPWCNLGFRSWACPSRSTWYPSRSHLSIVCLVKAFEALKLQAQVQNRLEWTSMHKRSLSTNEMVHSSSSQPFLVGTSGNGDLLSENNLAHMTKKTMYRGHKEDKQQLLHIKG